MLVVVGGDDQFCFVVVDVIFECFGIKVVEDYCVNCINVCVCQYCDYCFGYYWYVNCYVVVSDQFYIFENVGQMVYVKMELFVCYCMYIVWFVFENDCCFIFVCGVEMVVEVIFGNVQFVVDKLFGVGYCVFEDCFKWFVLDELFFGLVFLEFFWVIDRFGIEFFVGCQIFKVCLVLKFG